jgi:3',5'-cyclic AMP phosphodiesterase CpdA
LSRPTTFIHLSDLHLTAPGKLVHGIDSWGNVEQTLARIRRLSEKPAWVVVSGDLSEDGSAQSYEVLNGVVRDLEADGIPVLLALGNHDARGTFRQVVLGETGNDDAQPWCFSRQINGVRVIVLDSVIPGETGGALGETQLAWLERELNTATSGGTLIVLHHPCRLAAPARHFPDFILREAAALEAIVARSPERVHGILAGHSHQANAAPFSGTLHATAPAVLCQLDFFAGETYVPVPGAGFNLCRIQDGELIVTPVLVGAS